jgi:hypothetical protein
MANLLPDLWRVWREDIDDRCLTPLTKPAGENATKVRSHSMLPWNLLTALDLFHPRSGILLTGMASAISSKESIKVALLVLGRS